MWIFRAFFRFIPEKRAKIPHSKSDYNAVYYYNIIFGLVKGFWKNFSFFQKNFFAVFYIINNIR